MIQEVEVISSKSSVIQEVEAISSKKLGDPRSPSDIFEEAQRFTKSKCYLRGSSVIHEAKWYLRRGSTILEEVNGL